MGGAVEKVWFALGQEFARRGHEVVQISRAHPRLPKTERVADVTHLRVSGFDQPRSIVWLKFLDLIYSLRVHRILPRADILVTNTFWLPIIERTRRHGLIHVHVARFPKGQMRWYAHAARFLAVSRAIANAIIAQAPQLHAKVRVIPNPVPFRTDNSSDTSRSNTILFVGRVHPEKGIEMLLRAVLGLPPEAFSNWKLKIIGPHETRFGGGGNGFLRRLQLSTAQSSGRVEWLGPIFDEAELKAQYRACPIFVYPSLAETGEAFPVAPIEAMANGCVPLVSDLACFRDYIEDGVTGFVFDHRGEQAVESLGNRLASLLRLGHDELVKIGEAARAKAAEFAIEPVAQRYLNDFASLLAQARE